ncbi:MAG: type I secretion system permease/ATPase [Gammaproteobacteria bacterium]
MLSYQSQMTVSDLHRALHACRQSFLAVGIFSLFINALMLVPPLYMLQVYDRVLTTRNAFTLLMLSLLAVTLLLVMGGLEWVRARILIRVAARFDMALNGRLFNASFNLGKRPLGSATVQPIHDLTQLRQFLTSTAPFAFFDVPWLPIYVLALFLFHPLFGWVAIVGALMLLALTVANELSTRKPLAAANLEAIAASNDASSHLRNAEVLEALGMLDAIRIRWLMRYTKALALQALAGDRSNALSTASKSWRLILQSSALGIGAMLVIEHMITPGVMIAASLLMGRALAPIDMLISSWKGFVGARVSYRRLDELLRSVPQRPPAMTLPAPRGDVLVDRIVVAPPDSSTPVIRGVSFRLVAGESLGIIGPSASGKSTLVRGILGLWPCHAGTVRLDGADITTWNRAELGPYLGYLPQDVELFSGTIGENIARFGVVDADKVVAAARRAGVHEMILQLPQGYDTSIGVSGMGLSGGQRQRIALARALYGDPVLVVLDEPNSNVDEEGEQALRRALHDLKACAKTTMLLITHRPSLVESVDKMLVLNAGHVQLFGPRELVLAKLAQPAATPHPIAPSAPQARDEACALRMGYARGG